MIIIVKTLRLIFNLNVDRSDLAQIGSTFYVSGYIFTNRPSISLV